MGSLVSVTSTGSGGSTKGLGGGAVTVLSVDRARMVRPWSNQITRQRMAVGTSEPTSMSWRREDSYVLIEAISFADTALWPLEPKLSKAFAKRVEKQKKLA